MTKSIEKSFLIDLLNTNNVIYRDSLTLNGVLAPLTLSSTFYPLSPTNEVQLCLKRFKSKLVGIAQIIYTPEYAPSTKTRLLCNRKLGKETPKTFRKKLDQFSSIFNKMANFGWELKASCAFVSSFCNIYYTIICTIVIYTISFIQFTIYPQDIY